MIHMCRSFIVQIVAFVHIVCFLHVAAGSVSLLPLFAVPSICDGAHSDTREAVVDVVVHPHLQNVLIVTTGYLACPHLHDEDGQQEPAARRKVSSRFTPVYTHFLLVPSSTSTVVHAAPLHDGLLLVEHFYSTAPCFESGGRVNVRVSLLGHSELQLDSSLQADTCPVVLRPETAPFSSSFVICKAAAAQIVPLVCFGEVMLHVTQLSSDEAERVFALKARPPIAGEDKMHLDVNELSKDSPVRCAIRCLSPARRCRNQHTSAAHHVSVMCDGNTVIVAAAAVAACPAFDDDIIDRPQDRAGSAMDSCRCPTSPEVLGFILVAPTTLEAATTGSSSLWTMTDMAGSTSAARLLEVTKVRGSIVAVVEVIDERQESTDPSSIDMSSESKRARFAWHALTGRKMSNSETILWSSKIIAPRSLFEEVEYPIGSAFTRLAGGLYHNDQASSGTTVEVGSPQTHFVYNVPDHSFEASRGSTGADERLHMSFSRGYVAAIHSANHALASTIASPYWCDIAWYERTFALDGCEVVVSNLPADALSSSAMSSLLRKVACSVSYWMARTCTLWAKLRIWWLLLSAVVAFLTSRLLQ